MNKKERKDFAVRIICRKFANKNTMEKLQWSENVILVDADYVDKVAVNGGVEYYVLCVVIEACVDFKWRGDVEVYSQQRFDP